MDGNHSKYSKSLDLLGVISSDNLISFFGRSKGDHGKENKTCEYEHIGASNVFNRIYRNIHKAIKRQNQDRFRFVFVCLDSPEPLVFLLPQ